MVGKLIQEMIDLRQQQQLLNSTRKEDRKFEPNVAPKQERLKVTQDMVTNEVMAGANQLLKDKEFRGQIRQEGNIPHQVRQTKAETPADVTRELEEEREKVGKETRRGKESPQMAITEEKAEELFDRSALNPFVASMPPKDNPAAAPCAMRNEENIAKPAVVRVSTRALSTPVKSSFTSMSTKGALSDFHPVAEMPSQKSNVSDVISTTMPSVRDRKQAFQLAASKPTIAIRKLHIDQCKQGYPSSPWPKKDNDSAVMNRCKPDEASTKVMVRPASTSAKTTIPPSGSSSISSQQSNENSFALHQRYKPRNMSSAEAIAVARSQTSMTKQPNPMSVVDRNPESNCSTSGWKKEPSTKSTLGRFSPTTSHSLGLSSAPVAATLKQEPSYKGDMNRYPVSNSSNHAADNLPELKKEPSSDNLPNHFPGPEHNTQSQNTGRAAQLNKESSCKSVLNRYPVGTNDSRSLISGQAPLLQKEISSKSVLSRWQRTESCSSSHDHPRTSTPTVVKAESSMLVTNQSNAAATTANNCTNKTSAEMQEMKKEMSPKPELNRCNDAEISSNSTPSTSWSTVLPRQLSEKLGIFPYGNEVNMPDDGLAESLSHIDFPRRRGKRLGYHPFGGGNGNDQSASTNQTTSELAENTAPTPKPLDFMHHEASPSTHQNQIVDVSTGSLVTTDATARTAPLRTEPNLTKPRVETIPPTESDMNCNQHAGSITNTLSTAPEGWKTSSKSVLSRYAPVAPTPTKGLAQKNPATAAPLSNSGNLTSRYNASTNSYNASISGRNVVLAGKRRSNKLGWSIFGEPTSSSARNINEETMKKEATKTLTNDDAADVDNMTKGVGDDSTIVGITELRAAKTQSPNPVEDDENENEAQQMAVSEESEKEVLDAAGAVATVTNDEMKNKTYEPDFSEIFESEGVSATGAIEDATLEVVVDPLTDCFASDVTAVGPAEEKEDQKTNSYSDNEIVTEEKGKLLADVELAASSAKDKKSVSVSYRNDSVRFDDSFNVVHEYEIDVVAEHTDRLPLWWMNAVPHYTLEDYEVAANGDIGSFPRQSLVTDATDEA
jgi:hypothetical protein